MPHWAQDTQFSTLEKQISNCFWRAGLSLFHIRAFCAGFLLRLWRCSGFDYTLTLLGCLTEYFQPKLPQFYFRENKLSKQGIKITPNAAFQEFPFLTTHIFHHLSRIFSNQIMSKNLNFCCILATEILISLLAFMGIFLLYGWVFSENNSVVPVCKYRY